MHPKLRSTLLAATAIAAYSLPAAAQQAGGAQQAGNVTTDLSLDVGQAEKKFMDLARAIPADKYGWRPGQGVRSVGEVLMHVAADNYLLASALGFPADASTGIKGSDYNTAVAFEKRTMSRDAMLAELQKSFAHVRSGLTGTPANRLTEKVSLFGQSFTVQQAWILTVTHLHEHLGQLIAYARSNGIAPPWS
ncbi:MAG TPA: DinB family protein [Gemmatimonadaceae bacterium]|nr:DinB family protein [Gemmatimonadaceae bacterium]